MLYLLDELEFVYELESLLVQEWASHDRFCQKLPNRVFRFERDIEEGREELSISPMQCFKNALIDESVVSDGPCTSIIQHCQFERLGFFAVDHKSSTGGRIVFNQIVPLKDAKIIG